jgi:hypothetical protein
MIAVIHAYSRANAGDGLLVDLTLERLARAGVGPSQCVLFALDAPSFATGMTARQVGMPGRSLSLGIFRCLGEFGAASITRVTAGGANFGTLGELQEASAIVGVGGGYLRTGTAVSALGTLLNHLPQLAVASVAPGPTIYLPQSIGPLKGLVGHWVKEYLRDIDLIWARDDSTVAELVDLTTVRRAPDLAVLNVAELQPPLRTGGGGPVVLVARRLDRAGELESRLRELVTCLPTVLWAVQAEGPGSKHDGVFYRHLDVEAAGNLSEVLDQQSCGVVVSVRLHGALQALAAGVPAIHLSYQRKGWAAYADLGLEEYVHDARKFNPIAVAKQALQLRSDPSSFWERMTSRYDTLRDVSVQLDRSIAAMVARSGGFIDI